MDSSLLRAKKWLEAREGLGPPSSTVYGQKTRKKKRKKLKKKGFIKMTEKVPKLHPLVDPTAYKKARNLFEACDLQDLFDETMFVLNSVDCIKTNKFARKGRLECWGNGATVIGAAKDMSCKNATKSIAKPHSFKLEPGFKYKLQALNEEEPRRPSLTLQTLEKGPPSARERTMLAYGDPFAKLGTPTPNAVTTSFKRLWGSKPENKLPPDEQSQEIQNVSEETKQETQEETEPENDEEERFNVALQDAKQSIARLNSIFDVAKDDDVLNLSLDSEQEHEISNDFDVSLEDDVSLEAEREVSNVLLEANEEASNVLLEAKEEASNVLLEANEEVSNVSLEANEEVSNVSLETKEEASDVSLEANEEASNVLLEANEEVSNVLLEAKEEASNVSLDANEEASNVSLEVKQEVSSKDDMLNVSLDSKCRDDVFQLTKEDCDYEVSEDVNVDDDDILNVSLDSPMAKEEKTDDDVFQLTKEVNVDDDDILNVSLDSPMAKEEKTDDDILNFSLDSPMEKEEKTDDDVFRLTKEDCAYEVSKDVNVDDDDTLNVSLDSPMDKEGKTDGDVFPFPMATEDDDILKFSLSDSKNDDVFEFPTTEDDDALFEGIDMTAPSPKSLSHAIKQDSDGSTKEMDAIFNGLALTTPTPKHGTTVWTFPETPANKTATETETETEIEIENDEENGSQGKEKISSTPTSSSSSSNMWSYPMTPEPVKTQSSFFNGAPGSRSSSVDFTEDRVNEMFGDFGSVTTPQSLRSFDDMWANLGTSATQLTKQMTLASLAIEEEPNLMTLNLDDDDEDNDSMFNEIIDDEWST